MKDQKTIKEKLGDLIKFIGPAPHSDYTYGYGKGWIEALTWILEEEKP